MDMNIKLSTVLALVLISIFPAASFYAWQTQRKDFTEENAVEISINFLKNSPTYQFDGIPNSIDVVWIDILESYPVKYIVTIVFDCSHSGYGDRTGQVLAQVITHHEIKITVVEWNVIKAVIDDMWDELNQCLVGSKTEITCPEDGSLYVWTPIGTFSENSNWICFQCGKSWTKTYPEDTYERWRNAFLEPFFVRDYTLLYLRAVLEMDIPDPLKLDWIGGRETPEGIVGGEEYVYRAGSITATISYPVVLPENTVYETRINIGDLTIWEGRLHRREFFTDSPSQNVVYEYYGGVDIFDKGIHVVATSKNPMIMEASVSVTDTSVGVKDFWLLLSENITINATTDEFISIIISRGDKSTGGYTIQVKSFSWLESYPVVFRFAVDFTDPGEGVMVTEAITNPLALIPIGNLSPGEYVVEVHIVQYIMTFDEKGNPTYTHVKTLLEEIWKHTFVIE